MTNFVLVGKLSSLTLKEMKKNFEKACRRQDVANFDHKNLLQELLVLAKKFSWSKASDLIINGMQVPRMTMRFVYFRICGVWAKQILKSEIMLKLFKQLRFPFIYLVVYISYLK